MARTSGNRSKVVLTGKETETKQRRQRKKQRWEMKSSTFTENKHLTCDTNLIQVWIDQ